MLKENLRVRLPSRLGSLWVKLLSERLLTINEKQRRRGEREMLNELKIRGSLGRNNERRKRNMSGRTEKLPRQQPNRLHIETKIQRERDVDAAAAARGEPRIRGPRRAPAPTSTHTHQSHAHHLLLVIETDQALIRVISEEI
jgi:hypothetical protein